MNARLVVLVSGEGTNLQALIDACEDEGYGAAVVAVGADRDNIGALDRAVRHDIPVFTRKVRDFTSRPDWDQALTDACQHYEPDLIVSAGFMKLVGKPFLSVFGGRFLNTHPALLPSFPGMHGVREALEYGVKVTGCTVFLVDEGIDSGPVLAQAAVEVRDDDDEAALHERIKVAERKLIVDTVGRMAREGWTVESARKVRIGS
jgi:phosphoribosylglycinamide formyltransferase-1